MQRPMAKRDHNKRLASSHLEQQHLGHDQWYQWRCFRLLLAGFLLCLGRGRARGPIWTRCFAEEAREADSMALKFRS